MLREPTQPESEQQNRDLSLLDLKKAELKKYILKIFSKNIDRLHFQYYDRINIISMINPMAGRVNIMANMINIVTDQNHCYYDQYYG